MFEQQHTILTHLKNSRISQKERARKKKKQNQQTEIPQIPIITRHLCLKYAVANNTKNQNFHLHSRINKTKTNKGTNFLKAKN